LWTGGSAPLSGGTAGSPAAFKALTGLLTLMTDPIVDLNLMKAD
jgi:hypothetical protein